MTQQLINIGSAPNDGTGDPNRTAWDKSNDNFTELYAGAGGAGGLWNYNKTDIDTSTAPVSGRFKTNSGNYRDATQIAIHGTTIQGINRANTLRTLLIGDIIQCQDSTNGAAWCRYVVQAPPVDNTTWFQINVTLETDGGVASGDNQEIIFAFTAANVGAGGGGFATLASPAFTGNPTAPTPTAGDNDTSIATTSFVATAVAAIGGGFGPPQGRLTLQTGTPIMSTTQAAKTTIFYTPHVGRIVPLYDGAASWTMMPFAEISVLTTDTTKNPAAIGASKVNDWFVWNDVGTLRMSHGPDWTNDTTRSAGTALNRVNGILLNNASITNGPAANTGTYVGTTRSNASSQLDWIFGGIAATGTAGFLGVWNAYNRIRVPVTIGDTTASWTYNSVAWRNANASANNRVSFVRGLDEDGAEAQYQCLSSIASGGDLQIGVSLDGNTPTIVPYSAIITANSYNAFYRGIPGLGLHYLQAQERQTATPAAVTFYGGSVGVQTMALFATLTQ